MFYFDKNIKRFESEYSWDKALIYLESLFLKQTDKSILDSIVGFSWYYLIEGPIVSKKYDKDKNLLALDFWKRYLKIGLNNYKEDPAFCFIAGYTLLMNGFYIDEYNTNSELIGIALLKKAANTTNVNLKELVNLILKIHRQKKYEPLKMNKKTLDKLFNHDSLLEQYFKELYT